MNKTLEKQILTIIEVIKKMQTKLDNAVSYDTEIKELQSLITKIDKNTSNSLDSILKTIDELNNRDSKDDKENSLETIKSELMSYIKPIDVKKEIDSVIKDYATKNELNDVLKEIKTEKIIETIKEDTKFVEPKIKIGKVRTIQAGDEASVELRKVKDTYILDFNIPRGVSGRGMPGKDGLTTNVNGIEQVNGRIDLTTDDIPATEDNQYIATNEVALIHIEQQVYVLSGSAGSSFSLKTPSNINITSYEIETDVNCTCVVSIEDTNVSLTNEKTKLGAINIDKLANESITVSVDSNDNANWIKVYLNGVKL